MFVVSYECDSSSSRHCDKNKEARDVFLKNILHLILHNFSWGVTATTSRRHLELFKRRAAGRQDCWYSHDRMRCTILQQVVSVCGGWVYVYAALLAYYDSVISLLNKNRYRYTIY